MTWVGPVLSHNLSGQLLVFGTRRNTLNYNESHLLRLSPYEVCQLRCLSPYEVCRLRYLLPYGVCRLWFFMFVALLHLLRLTFAALWRLPHYDVCWLWRISVMMFVALWGSSQRLSILEGPSTVHSRLCGWSHLVKFLIRNLSYSPWSEPSRTVLLLDVMYTMYARHPS